MKPSIVNIANLHKSFGSQQVLQGVNWDIAQGKVIGLLGRNGAGKSTLLECLLGLREADSGACTLFGQPATALGDPVRAAIGYVPQKSELFEWLTPVQMLDYFKALYPRWNADKVAGLLDRWGFAGEARHKQIGRLSGGRLGRLVGAALVGERRRALGDHQGHNDRDGQADDQADNDADERVALLGA